MPAPSLSPPPKKTDDRFDDWMFQFYKSLSPARLDWTPGISFGGGTTGIAYTTQTASCTKLMDLVFVAGIIVLSNKGSSTGTVLITGLPYAVQNDDAHGRSTAQYSMNGITFTGQFQGNPVKNSTTMNLSQMTEAGTFTNLTDANFSNTSTIIFSVFYRTS